MQKGILNNPARLLLLMLLTCGVTSYGQDIVKVRNQNFTSYFSRSQHIPVLVVYSLTPDMFNCTKLKGEHSIKLAADPQLADVTSLKDDYNNSLFEDAQMMAPHENLCDKDAYTESFYFTNVMPMPKNLYKELWEKLHAKEIVKAKKFKKVKVFAGTVGRNWVIGAYNNVVVPEWCWKVIYIPSTDEYLCYQFHNIEPYNPKDNLANHKVDISTIESLAGVRFVNGVISAPYVTPTPNN
ncbi:MAG: non-specific endonuclease [Flavipsychrobacter sp.]|jgi:DNA/RNA endonuclease G (NUC1)|nr:non-specific endonuclease [Flavipsychrobacter sp.]